MRGGLDDLVGTFQYLTLEHVPCNMLLVVQLKKHRELLNWIIMDRRYCYG